MTKTDMNAMVLLGLRGSPELTVFCKELVDRRIYLSIQSARNAIGKLCTDKKLIVKEGGHKKTVTLSPDIKISTAKNTLLSINCIYR